VPTYDYQCRSCGTVTELIHSMLEAGPSTCEKCGGELRRVLFPAGIIFKGSGFYRNDSRASSSQGGASAQASKPGSNSAEKGPGSSDAGKAGSTSSEGGGSPSQPKSADSEKP